MLGVRDARLVSESPSHAKHYPLEHRDSMTTNFPSQYKSIRRTMIFVLQGLRCSAASPGLDLFIDLDHQATVKKPIKARVANLNSLVQMEVFPNRCGGTAYLGKPVGSRFIDLLATLWTPVSDGHLLEATALSTLYHAYFAPV